jgi:hypothetical protein
VTAAKDAAPPQASFATNWYVTGVGRFGDVEFVSLKSRDLSTAFSLYSGEPDPGTGVMLSTVNWSETIGKTTVTLRKGTETAVLEFNQALLATTPPVPIGGPHPAPSQNAANNPAQLTQQGRRVRLPPKPSLNNDPPDPANRVPVVVVAPPIQKEE